jgi:hypothetical protein
MAMAENDGQQIFFEDVGSGTPLVLGHLAALEQPGQTQ